ncbi:hypothetical protein GVN16_03625 [Emticicia sp. CRIBPO]|uniref:hypothetical protein n=1 Tax=Emticicia sp. CRIBPO TaxID=2683258 RepID=UPI001412B81B|nr:hypothetical protein [Emticicia sp. CRIBPO]NBA84831.1 hypothetical protein [Emticicia sp. CRIBPO]
MPYHYQAYGIPVVSSMELPALIPASDNEADLQPIMVEAGAVPDFLVNAPLEIKPFSTFNENEFRYEVPGVAKYYVVDGQYITIEILGNNLDEILLYFYSNCLAAALFQRNLIPFHVSGVFVKENEVLLFAAPSRTGKSTTALMLQHKGYDLFTDDTALLYVHEGQVFAKASYPMLRLWQNTVEKQSIYSDSDKQHIYGELDKYGFSFHEKFTAEAVLVKGIVFLEERGADIQITETGTTRCMKLLVENIYRGQWLDGMKKQRVRFENVTKLANVLPAWQAARPRFTDTFDSFAEAIDSQIIKKV